MTPAQHLAKAEIAQDAAAGLQAGELGFTATDALLDAIAHALIAIAGELGVPHAAAPGGGAPNGGT